MMGELLLSIPGLQFAFTQAPSSMKSVVTAAWFLNNAFGNLIVVIITQLDALSSQKAEYFFYAVLMLVCIIIFTLLAYEYGLQELKSDMQTGDLVVLLPNATDNVPSPSSRSGSV